MKLEETKNLQNAFKSNLSEILSTQVWWKVKGTIF